MLANRYQIVQMLGEGGFGQTFLAEDTQMPSKRLCVIKQLKPMTNEPAVYQVVQERFQREAAILEKLGEQHAQIPKLYAYFGDAGQFYLVQEWIEGLTLEQFATNQGVLSESTVRKILLGIVPVLEFVHAQGMIHRDIKPENIILRNHDRTSVLIDFGAVRETMGTVFNSRGNPTSSIVIGTPGYMSPEQAAGRPIPSSDLYSLGLTAIYLLTGKSPQLLETDPTTGEILWQQFAPQLSPDLAEILTRMVRSHPRDRFTTATQVRAALEPSTTIGTAVLLSPPSSVMPAPNPDRSKLITAGLIGGGLVISAIAASLLLNRTADPTPIVIQSPSPSPSIQATPETPRSPEPSEPIVRSPEPVSTPTAVTKSISQSVMLKEIAGGRVQVYAQPSTRSNSPHYGIPGDRVMALKQAQGEDRTSWYFVRFPSGAEGWIPEAQTRRTDDIPPEPSFPQSAELIGQFPGSRINLRSAPSMSASSDSYGLVGDQVIALKQAEGEDGKLWYLVRFPSQASGWVRQDLIRLQD